MNDDRITLGHGSGGRLTHELVETVFKKTLADEMLDTSCDSAIIGPISGHIAMTTDAFVVSPLFFEGGDIGSLAINGTVNDLAVAGAEPRFISASFILEEGLCISDVSRIAASMARAASLAGVHVVAGDTKVVERGHGDGVYITTTGIGKMRDEPPAGIQAVQPGDIVLVSGPVGDHGAVIAAHRNGLEVEGGLTSDCASVATLVDAMYDAGVRPVFMRDPTRGGLATVLAEVASSCGLPVEIYEKDIPVRAGVTAVCDVLGIDPLYLACEGRVVVFTRPEQAATALDALRSRPEGALSTVIGRVMPGGAGPVVLVTRFGGRRLYDILASDPLPRIC